MKKLDENQSGLQCFWSNLKDHPKCIHGPTLLFGQSIDNEVTKFYLCSACRHQKLCPFYLKHNESLDKSQQAKLAEKTKKYVSTYHRQQMFLDLHKVLASDSSRRLYCHTCEKLFLIDEKSKHESHECTEGLTDQQLSYPTKLIKPATDSKKEAQYLFSKNSVKDVVGFLKKFGAEQVLCIGAPRIHEYITNKLDGKMSSLLMDLDGRFHNFYGALNFCWYNLFNHHFFYPDSKAVFKDFITQNNGKNLFIVCDPPFGGRVEAIAQTLKTISDSYKKWNNLEDEEPKVLFFFPYFMAPIMQNKSSPPTVSGGLKDYKMVEYRVEYDNHPLFVKRENIAKLGSPVRIFTNIPLSEFKLSDSDYKYCKKCQRWVTIANKHCKKCNNCTSKDGRSYKHCDVCERCVKDFWIHCKKCQRCCTVEHNCGRALAIFGTCNRCGQTGHTEKQCQVQDNGNLKRKNDACDETKKKTKKKRGSDVDNESKPVAETSKRRQGKETKKGKSMTVKKKIK